MQLSDLSNLPQHFSLSGDRRCFDGSIDHDITLQCPPDTNIDQVLFASVGNPTGTCGSYHHGDCHVTSRLVEDHCVGNNTCVITVAQHHMLHTQCVRELGDAARWKVQVTCKRLCENSENGGPILAIYATLLCIRYMHVMIMSSIPDMTIC